ncbi:MAG: Gfo/Idh/MocA family oxidoreductase [Xanthomonadales bacterium]|nr:Gfo/Idh/MocA family oxidoreductase [Xanthomonadales bacterium]
MPNPGSASRHGLTPPVRWGFVGTGNIASWMAGVLGATPAARLCAVASRDMSRAQEFAGQHGAELAFDHWRDMIAWEDLDAIYVATPTSLREEISIAAAQAGKHVLGEKPFASLASLERITGACRQNGVGFMDATHFVHHPRHSSIRNGFGQMIGRPRALHTRFCINLTDRNDIRYDPALEPLGAIGDLGWYNMRAMIEYLSSAGPVTEVRTHLTRDDQTGVLLAGEGSLTFGNSSVSSWQCSFKSSVVDIGLELEGSAGHLHMDNFIGEDADHAASYQYRPRGRPVGAETTTRVDSTASGPAMMFADFAALTVDPTLREQWMKASERTQALLDSVLEAAGA